MRLAKREDQELISISTILKFSAQFNKYLKYLLRFVDIGVYGVPKRPGFNAEVVTRKIEDFVRFEKIIAFSQIFILS